MKVTVIVPTFNQERWIGSCLESVVTQSLNAPFEIWVLDDASTDQTPAIIREYTHKYPQLVRAFTAERNLGDYGVRNAHDAFARSEAEYLCTVDGDDMILPGKLQAMSQFLDAHPECAMVGHCMQILDGEERTSQVLYQGLPTVADIGYYCSRDIVLQGMMFRRDAIPPEGFLYDAELMRNYDYIHQAQLGEKGQVGFIDEVLGLYRVHPESYTQTRGADDIDRMLNGRIRSLDYIKEKQVISERDYFVSMRTGYCNACEEHLRKKHFEHFCHCLVEATKRKVVSVEADLDYQQREFTVRCKF